MENKTIFRLDIEKEDLNELRLIYEKEIPDFVQLNIGESVSYRTKVAIGDGFDIEVGISGRIIGITNTITDKPEHIKDYVVVLDEKCKSNIIYYIKSAIEKRDKSSKEDYNPHSIELQ